MSNIKLSLLFVTYLALFNTDVGGVGVKFENNGYSDIVVAVSPNVPQTGATTIIDNIKHMITKASGVLFEATKRRAYFKDVRILIPDKWDTIVPDEIVGWEIYEDADIKIEPANLAYGDEPYTLQDGVSCGDPGDYIHFTPNYISTLKQVSNIKTYGPPEKVFVHEWARYRYGVFEEYGKGLDTFYLPKGQGLPSPTLCSDDELQFTTSDVANNGASCTPDPSTQLYDQNCIYTIDPTFSTKSSLMSTKLLRIPTDSVVHFCSRNDTEFDKHNSAAPTKQNIMCNNKGTWDIIVSHEDFKDENINPPAGNIIIDPKFIIIRAAKGNRFVMINDISGSMASYDRITALYDTANQFVQYQIPDGNYLGLVEFSAYSTITSELVLIETEEDRNKLSAKLPKRTEGSTCIGCGIQHGLDVLRSSGYGGVLILLSDGEENVRPYIQDVLPHIYATGVRVCTVAFGNDATGSLEDLSTKTGGCPPYFVDDYNIVGLHDAFNDALEYMTVVPYDEIIVSQFQEQFSKVPARINRSFFVDESIGRNFELRISYTQRSYLQDVLLISPSGVLYGFRLLKFNDETKTAFFNLTQAQVGKWSLGISVPSSNLVDSISVYITSQSRDTSTAPITADCYIPDGSVVEDAGTKPSRVLAKVVQGSTPIIGAKVTAFIEGPNGAKETLEVLDNGIAADSFANDGIYSRFFTTAVQAGRYTVYCEVSGGAATFIQTRNRRDTRGTPGKMVSGLSRVSSAGSFKVMTPLSGTRTYAPNRVIDLRATIADENIKTLNLQFTAPGGSLDNGQATRYEIKYSENHEDLFEENFVNGPAALIRESMDVGSSPLIPSPAGTIQTFTVLLPSAQPETTIFFALRTFNKEGQFSSTSNIAAIRLPSI